MILCLHRMTIPSGVGAPPISLSKYDDVEFYRTKTNTLQGRIFPLSVDDFEMIDEPQPSDDSGICFQGNDIASASLPRCLAASLPRHVTPRGS